MQEHATLRLLGRVLQRVLIEVFCRRFSLEEGFLFVRMSKACLARGVSEDFSGGGLWKVPRNTPVREYDPPSRISHRIFNVLRDNLPFC